MIDQTKYRIEVPMYAYPLRHLRDLKQRADVEIIIYGGIPNSPLNGGRPNFLLDNLFLFDRLFLSLNTRQLDRLMAKFYRTIEEANKAGIPFFCACTNLFIDAGELTSANLEPFRRMVETGARYGIKNGVIVNNRLLEERVRRDHGDKLVYVGSCTKYVIPARVLTHQETLRMYEEDVKKYDFVVITPQDSQNKDVIAKVLEVAGREKIIAISNAYCGAHCNSYYHYECFSRINKENLLGINSFHLLKYVMGFSTEKLFKCPVPVRMLSLRRPLKLATMQIEAGVMNFKLGRGVGQDSLDNIAALILKHTRHKAQDTRHKTQGTRRRAQGTR